MLSHDDSLLSKFNPFCFGADLITQRDSIKYHIRSELGTLRKLTVLYVKVFENGNKTAICLVMPQNKTSLHPPAEGTLCTYSYRDRTPVTLPPGKPDREEQTPTPYGSPITGLFACK